MTQLTISKQSLMVLMVNVITQLASWFVEIILENQPILKLITQGILWALSAIYIFVGILNRWKEYRSKSKQ